ncbi:hypothetical protein [Bradyrhizobium sp.]|uniref:hypothetical protein n=1 Tax=Bradyrhizobium sp. TaxID=376 RepID=UPI003C74EE6E
MSRSLSCIRVTIALAAVAIILAGCAAANNTSSSQGEQPHQTGYGLSSEGTTTDLYTELFGSRKTATAAAAAQPVQPVTASAAPQPVQPATAAAPSRQAQPATATSSARQPQPASAVSRQVQPAPTEVAQQAATPQAPDGPDVPVAYGITANGPTTDLYTTLFGPRRRDGQ